MEFLIEITETLQKVVKVEAANLVEALVLTSKKYKSGAIVLDSEDYVGYEINEYKETSDEK